MLVGDTAALVSPTGSAPRAKITWEPFNGLWVAGTKFTLKKFNRDDGTQESISLDEEQARQGFYIDKNIPTCKKIQYAISLALGNKFSSPPDSAVSGSIVTRELATVGHLTASKGYFPDRTTLRWTTSGSYDNYMIKRKVYGRPDKDYVQIATVEGSGLKEITADDEKGTPGVYYQYKVMGVAQCSNETLHSNADSVIGFRSPTGTVYGRITYDNGGGAVRDATVRMESATDTPLGKSLYLDGQQGSSLTVDSLSVPFSDSAFTFEAWIKPEGTPKDEVIFENPGLYRFGFNPEGKIYFNYRGHQILGDFKDSSSFTHLATIHDGDSLWIIQDTSIVAAGAVPYRSGEEDNFQYLRLGSNSDYLSNYKGYLDEVRIWNRALSDSEIIKDASRLLTGGEKNLMAYWRFDGTIKDQFYDLSHNGDTYNRNNGTMNAQHVRRSNTIPSPDQLSLKAYTDRNGNYTITGIPYFGINGTTYTVAPKMGTHNFDPVAVTRIFSSGSSTFTLDFKDKSSYIVSGTVTYAHTNVPVQGVQFKIDGNYAYTGNNGIAQTNEKGAFTISVPVGVHTVQAVKANHVFINEGKILVDGHDVNYQENMTNIPIYDSTTVHFIGRIAGGPVNADYPLGFSLSKNILGQNMSITLTSAGQRFLNTTGKPITTYYRHAIYSNQQGGKKIMLPDSTKVVYYKNKIVIFPDLTTGEFEANLIPADFLIDQNQGVVVKGYQHAPLSATMNLDLTDSLLTRNIIDSLNTDSVYHLDSHSWSYTTSIDTVKYNASSVFNYNVDPVVTVQQAMGAENPYTFDYFGNASYTFKNILNEKTDIPVYNMAAKKYTFGYPVFVQGNSYTFKIRSFQHFPYYDKNGEVEYYTDIPSQGGKVNLHNEIGSGSASPNTFTLDSTGTAFYTFWAGIPEFADDHLKGFSVSLQIGNSVYQWNNGLKQYAYVFGGVSDGNDFVTAGPNEQVGILRDPPGTNSYAYLEKGFTTTHTIQRSYGFDLSKSAGAKASLVPEVKLEEGAPTILVGSTVEPIAHVSGSYIKEKHRDSTNTLSSSVIFSSRIETSDDPSFDGASDDIFIGYSTNITYGQSRILCAVPSATVQNTDSVVWGGKGKTTYSIVEREGFHFGQKFSTMYIYPQSYIINYLIPNLIKIRNKILAEGTSYDNPQKAANTSKQEVYVSLLDTSDTNYGVYNMDTTVWQPLGKLPEKNDYSHGPSYKIYFPKDIQGNIIASLTKNDTIMTIDQHIQGWTNWLKKNEKEKLTSSYDKNYSFGAGSSLDISNQVSSSSSHEEHYKFVWGGNWELESGVLVNKAGLVAVGTGQITHTPTDTTGTMTHDTTRTIGFHLEEGGSNYMSISKGDDSNGFPLYQIKGGVTSCPYEGGDVTKFYKPGTLLNQKTLQREEPEINVAGQSVVTGIAANRAASYTLNLSNASGVKGDIYFGLNVIDKSNPYGAKIYLDGTPLGNGRTLLIPAGKKLTKTLTVEKGPDSMNYDNLKIVLHSTCQYNPVVYSYNIADTATITAHFQPGCSDIHLSSPKDKWILNTLSPEIVNDKDSIPYLPVVLDQYELTKSNFNHIALQYKRSNSSQWITVVNFYTDEKNFNNAKGGIAKELITSPDETDYQFLMNSNFADGAYDIRALSVCMENGKELASTPSNVVSGIKDMYRPRPFGHPDPVDGIMGIGQNAEITFNEPIDIGYLNQQTPSTFFSVRAIKNGSATDSTVAIHLDGVKDYGQTEFNKNLTGKDFTISLWLMPDKKEGGTLFSQGDKNESLSLSLTADYHFRVHIGNRSMTSGSAIKYAPGQWVHAALEYNAADSSINVFYNSNKVIKNAKAPVYKGVGPFIFGKDLRGNDPFFAGKIRNVRVWTEDLSSIQLQEKKNITLSGNENHLLACYPMNEGKGSVLRDIAHGNNVSFTGEWKTPEGRSVTFSGRGDVRLNTAQAVITPEMNFTLSLWFKGQPGQTDAALISNGKGDGTNPDGSENLYCLGFEKGHLTFSNNSFKVEVPGSYLDNNWHQVAIAANRNTGTANIYVDGELKKFFDANNLGGLTSTSTYLGARAYHTATDSTVTHFDHYFKGNIDEVRIWNTYLNSTLVALNSNTKLNGHEAGLLAYYPFEEQSLSSSNVAFTQFTPADQKVQHSSGVHVPDAVLDHALESEEKAPMKEVGSEQDIPYSFVPNKDAIVFNFSGGNQEMKAIDNTIVTFSTRNVRDLHGNYMASPETWTAYIDQNPLEWSDEELNLTKTVNKSMQFSAYVINKGGKEEKFRMSNLPPWLRADVVSGTVALEGKQKITFTVNTGLNVGSYDDIIEMTNDQQETRGLAVNIEVNGNAPDWKVNPSDFEYNMTVYGKLRIDKIYSVNPKDMLAAFINGKCVGVAYNTYLKKNDFWYVFLTVYSDSLESKNLSFRIWDASTGKIYSGIPSESIDFSNDAVFGTPRQPVIFDGLQRRIENISLQKGWNWLSFNMYNAQLEDVNAMLSNGSWEPGDEIKNALKGFDQYSVTEGWMGTLEHGFDNLSLFKLETALPQTLSIAGTPLDLQTTAIPLLGGQWNYISYLPLQNLPVNDALADYHAHNGDQIKSQTGFAMYDSQLGWVGNLTYLEPGKGYMLYRSRPSDTSFTYPYISDIFRQSTASDAMSNARINPYEWPVAQNFYYPNNMTVVAAVGKGFHLLSGDKILAYAGTELRAKAKAMANPATGKQALFFNIPGRTSQLLHFEIQRNGKMIAETPPVMSYQSDKIVGSLRHPFLLDFGKHEWTAGIYPNPFHKSVRIRLHLSPGLHSIRMKIYDMQGQLVYKKRMKNINGTLKDLLWNGDNNLGAVCTSGVYLIRLQIDTRHLVYKVIKY